MHQLHHHHHHCPSRRPAARHRASGRCPAAAASPTTTRVHVRPALLSDTQDIAKLMAEVFGASTFAAADPAVRASPFIQQVEASYASAIQRDDKLAAALVNKAQAALEHRTYRLGREAALLKARLAVARGEPASFPTEGPAELRQLSKWRRARQFVCLVAEEVTHSEHSSSEAGSTEAGSSGPGSSSNGSSGSRRTRLLGTATISMMQAEAALPPPFPSAAPLRAYISNMAVARGARRQGVGSALCAACGRVARAWGEPRVLLHVAADNAGAQRMYSAVGFQPVSNSSGLSGVVKGPWTQQRMVAKAPELARSGGSSKAAANP